MLLVLSRVAAFYQYKGGALIAALMICTVKTMALEALGQPDPPNENGEARIRVVCQ